MKLNQYDYGVLECLVGILDKDGHRSKAKDLGSVIRKIKRIEEEAEIEAHRGIICEMCNLDATCKHHFDSKCKEAFKYLRSDTIANQRSIATSIF